MKGRLGHVPYSLPRPPNVINGIRNPYLTFDCSTFQVAHCSHTTSIPGLLFQDDLMYQLNSSIKHSPRKKRAIYNTRVIRFTAISDEDIIGAAFQP